MNLVDRLKALLIAQRAKLLPNVGAPVGAWIDANIPPAVDALVWLAEKGLEKLAPNIAPVVEGAAGLTPAK